MIKPEDRIPRRTFAQWLMDPKLFRLPAEKSRRVADLDRRLRKVEAVVGLKPGGNGA